MKKLLFLVLLCLGTISGIITLMHIFLPVPMIVPGHILIHRISDIVFGNGFFIQIRKYGIIDINWFISLIYTIFTFLCAFTMKRTRVLLIISTVVYACEILFVIYILIRFLFNFGFENLVPIVAFIWMLFEGAIVFLHINTIFHKHK